MIGQIIVDTLIVIFVKLVDLLKPIEVGIGIMSFKKVNFKGRNRHLLFHFFSINHLNDLLYSNILFLLQLPLLIKLVIKVDFKDNMDVIGFEEIKNIRKKANIRLKFFELAVCVIPNVSFSVSLAVLVSQGNLAIVTARHHD